MARNKGDLTNIDKSDLPNYPNGRLQNNLGAGNGTPVNEIVYGDMHEFFAKLMREYGIEYNGIPDNETNTYQLIEAARALASKNDYVLDLNSSGGVLEIPVKLGKLKDNESFILKATVDKGIETQIRGLFDNSTKIVSFIGGDFLEDEYVRMINTSTSVVLMRLVDGANLDAFTSALNYLKAASQTQENAGTSNDVATTPLTNKTVLSRRINGADSNGYLAIPTGTPGSRPGTISADDLQTFRGLADPASLIQITSATDVAVNSPAGGSLQDNFNFNYVDVTPPSGKTMVNLRGFMASTSECDQNPANPDSFWCKWQVQSNKIRVICGDNHFVSRIPKVNWLAIWI